MLKNMYDNNKHMSYQLYTVASTLKVYNNCTQLSTYEELDID